MERLLYTIPEAATMLGLTEDHVRRLWVRGDLRVVRVGRCNRVPATEIQRLADEAANATAPSGTHSIEIDDDDSDEQCDNVLYRFFDASGVLLYIGISKSYLGRLSTHESTAPWFRHAATCHIEHIRCSRQHLERIEKRAIQTERPRWNRRHNEGNPHRVDWRYPEADMDTVFEQMREKVRQQRAMDEVA